MPTESGQLGKFQHQIMGGRPGPPVVGECGGEQAVGSWELGSNINFGNMSSRSR